MKRSLASSESSIQQSFIEWVSFQYPKVRKVTFSIPNSGKRTFSYAQRLKREGMTKGAPDLIMCVSNGLHHGMIIEFKKPGGRLTINQDEMLRNLEFNNYKTCVCYSLEEAMDVTNQYLRANSND